MAAGLGYIEFTTGDILTASIANGYLASQTVMVFASAAARTSAITSPQEGMISYLKDTDKTQYYTGSAWADIAPASGGGMTLLSTTTLSGASTTISVSATGYNNLQIVVSGMTCASSNDYPRMDINGSSGAVNLSGTSQAAFANNSELYWAAGQHEMLRTGGNNVWVVNIYNPDQSSYYKAVDTRSAGARYDAANVASSQGGHYGANTAISSIKITTINGGNSFNGGQVKIYGVK